MSPLTSIVTTDGLRLSATAVGAGAAGVIVPNGAYFAEALAPVWTRHPALVYDLRNRGASDPVADAARLERGVLQDVGRSRDRPPSAGCRPDRPGRPLVRRRRRDALRRGPSRPGTASGAALAVTARPGDAPDAAARRDHAPRVRAPGGAAAIAAGGRCRGPLPGVLGDPGRDLCRRSRPGRRGPVLGPVRSAERARLPQLLDSPCRAVASQGGPHRSGSRACDLSGARGARHRRSQRAVCRRSGLGCAPARTRGC